MSDKDIKGSSYVRFNRTHGSYAANDIAGFSRDHATWLDRSGAATKITKSEALELAIKRNGPPLAPLKVAGS